jgi:hypothetical protein
MLGSEIETTQSLISMKFGVKIVYLVTNNAFFILSKQTFSMELMERAT